MDDIKGTVAKLAKSVTKTSGTLIKTTKLTLNLSGAEDELKRVYQDIGRKVEEIYLYGGSLGKAFDEQYKELKEKQAKIAAIKEQLNAAKGTRECPKCGRVVERSAEFCPKCGAVLAGGGAVSAAAGSAAPAVAAVIPPALNPPAPVASAAVAVLSVPEPVVEGWICPVCGAKNLPGDKFCLSCGRMKN